jgi:hypothetical protein
VTYRNRYEERAGARAAREAAEHERRRRTEEERMGITIGDDFSSPSWLAHRMAEGLTARLLGRAPSEIARTYVRSSLAQAADACNMAAGIGRHLDPAKHPGRVFELALGTSDFPFITANVLNKLVLERYEAAAPSYRTLARKVEIRDFKPTAILRGGDFPSLLEIGEAGEVKRGLMTESKEEITLATVSRISPLTLAALANDDAGALAGWAEAAAARAVAWENDTFYAVVLLPNSGAGQTMRDTNPLFHSSRSNIASAGALSASLGDARSKLKTQATPDGIKLNNDLHTLLVPPASQQAAEALVATLAPTATIRVLADANLTGTRYYGFTDPARLPFAVYGYLQGQAGPSVIAQAGWASLGLDVRLTLSFACAAVEPRAAVTGAGA